MLVDRIGQLGNFALRLDRQFPFQVAVGHGGHDLAMPRTWLRQVARHEVHVIGQILPRSRDPFTLACPPSLPSVPTSRATRVTSAANDLS